MAVGRDDCSPDDASAPHCSPAVPQTPPQPGLLKDLFATSVWRVLPLILLYTIGKLPPIRDVAPQRAILTDMHALHAAAASCRRRPMLSVILLYLQRAVTFVGGPTRYRPSLQASPSWPHKCRG